MELEGRIIKVMDVQSFDSGFTKREFVVNTYKETYPQDIKFEVFKDKCSMLDQYNPGDAVKVEFNIRGNEYNGKYYVTLQAWKLEKQAQETEAVFGGTPQYANAPSLADMPDSPDDLPF